MATLETAAAYVMTLISANVAAIKSAPAKPPEKPSEFPFAVIWPSRGRAVSETPDLYKDLAELILEIHVARKNLPTAIDSVYPLHEQVLAVLMSADNATLGGNVDTVRTNATDGGGIGYVFGGLDYGGVETIGFQYTIPIKQVRSP